MESTVASLLRQVVSQKSVLPKSLNTKPGEPKLKLQIQDLERILLHICQDFDQVFIPIDALDECDEAMRRKHFLPFLAALQKIPSIRLFITSRPYLEDIRKALDPAPQIHVQASDTDLRMYLRRRIEESGNADIIDEDFKQRLIDTVTKGAQGMYVNRFLSASCVHCRTASDFGSRFLLPALQIESILSEPTTGDMEDAMKNKPHDLHQAFYQTLARIQRQPEGRKRLGMNVLLWLSHFHGSLTVAELSEAMAIRPGDTSLNPRRRPSQNMMIECCMGLATIDLENSSIHLVHYALQEFFLDQRRQVFPSGEDQIAEICIGYLFFDEFGRGCCVAEAEIAQTMRDFPLLRYASTYWGHHARPSHCDRIYRLALELLHCSPRRALAIQVENFSRGFWHKYWEPAEVTSHSAFHCACRFGLERAISDTLKLEDVDIDAATNIGTTALIAAASYGHLDMIKLLLNRGADPKKSNWYGSALHCAAEAGRCESIRLLLDSGMNIDLINDFGRTPLHCATDKRHVPTIELLLDMGADPNVQAYRGISLIHDAAQIGDERLMRRLLRDERVNITATTINGETALHRAAAGDHADIVRMLLGAGLEINAKKIRGFTALHLATRRGHRGVVWLLVEAGANVNAKSDDGYTAMYFAIAHDHEGIQKLLLEHGAEKGVFEYQVIDSEPAGEDEVT